MVSASVAAEVGGVRADITLAAHMVLGEDRTISWEVQDDNCEPVASLVGYEFTFVLTDDLTVNASDLDFVVDASRIFVSTDVDTQTAPNVEVPLLRAETRDLENRQYAYELWRTGTGTTYRLAYGTFLFIP